MIQAPRSPLLQALWASPTAVWRLDECHHIADVNDAALALLALPRERLVGQDPVALQPAEDRDNGRDAWARALGQVQAGGPLRCRLLDGLGIERWVALTLLPQPATQQTLVLVHDETAEQAARSQSLRAEEELAQWFELSGSGMLVYDSGGLILRSNAAFEALVEKVPELLQDANPALQALLAWGPQGMLPELHSGPRRTHAVERQTLLPLADGRQRRLWARLLPQPGDASTRRVLAVVQDRSAEDERDLAQLEMGMLMDTASVRVATYEPSRGWLPPSATNPAGVAQEAQPTLGVGIRRDLVEPESMAEYERLQQALRNGERAEVRYAVRHPDVGTRWLLTRVEPALLQGGRPTMSVVTLDVTEQERAQRRNDQLLRELTTILDSSTAGIAYLRGPVLVRCNLRFERMLGFEPGAAAGASLEEILSRSVGPLDGVRDALEALGQGRPFEAELPLVRGEGPAQWYSLSVRRAEGEPQQTEAVAVLTDITRLKAQQAELEQLLRDRDLMFNLSEVGIVFQRGARIERANQAMAELTGWSSPELGTLDTAELYEDTRACVDFEARVSHGLREQGRFSAERLLCRRDGRLLWVQVAVRPVDADDIEAGLICAFVDIDERRRAREALSVQAERTRAILNSVLVGIVSVSPRGIEWMNRSARRMFSGELADFVGEPISIVATPEPEHPLRRSDWVQRLQQGQAETFECRMRGRDGREFWVVGNAVLSGATGDSGAGDEVTFALLDIERRRQAEVSIAQAQASLQRVIETAPLAIALFDARSLHVLQLNQTVPQLFGRSADQVLGATPEQCAAPALAAPLTQWLQALAQGGTQRQREWHDAASGRVWDCRFSTLEEDGGAPSQLLLVASDVTEQRAAEQARLQAAIAQREVLVREVHHRIKNNLQGVAGLLQQNAQRHPELATLLGEAVGQVQAIAQVYGLQVGAQGPLEVLGLAKAIAASVQRTFGRAIQVLVQGEVPHLLPEAEAIPVALTVNELLTNAIKHGQGGELRCELWTELDDRADCVLIQISGSGQLPAGFDLAAIRGGVAGLALVRALLPRRSASFTLTQQGAEVVARVQLRPPSVRRPQPEARLDQRQSTS
jgi:PAS domain S-box-containing protein